MFKNLLQIILRIIFLTIGIFLLLFRTNKSIIAENTALKLQLSIYKENNPRPKISNINRIIWIAFIRLWKDWKKFTILFKPDTAIKWHKNGFKHYWTKISQKNKNIGRPWKNKEIRSLIRKMAFDNITWGAPRVHGELLKLGIDVSERTVSRYLPKRNINGEKTITWITFLKNQTKGIIATDFFTIPTISFKNLYVLFIINHFKRKILHVEVTYNPGTLFVTNQLEKVFDNKDNKPKYIIFDRGSAFSKKLKEFIESYGVKVKQTAYKSPWQNGIAERWVGNVRRDLLDHAIIFNKKHLKVLLDEYVDYYNKDRTHYSLNKEPPEERKISKKLSENAKVVTLPRISGLHHKYIWKDSA